MGDTPKSKSDSPDQKPGAEPAKDAKDAKPEPPKPIAVGDVLDGWTVEAINGQDVLLSSGAERRTRALADLEKEREAGPASKIAVGDVIDGWTVQAINNPTDVVCTQGGERRSLSLADLENAKRAAQALTDADLARTKTAAAAPEPGKPAGPTAATR
jgi:hypothetical protein